MKQKEKKRKPTIAVSCTRAPNRAHLKKIIFLSLGLIFFQSCQTYTSAHKFMRDELSNGHVSKAIKILDDSDLRTQKRNYALFRMEKGMLLYLNKNYNFAIDLWLQADSHLDALYTTSLSRTGLSFALNDSMSDYTSEAHERILLPLFASMAFFTNNDLNNALVLIRRTHDVTRTLQNENKGKNNFKYDAFSHYFSGMVYEAKNELDNAIVEYRLAREDQLKSVQTGIKPNAQAQNEILKALGRLAEYKNRRDVLNDIKKTNSSLKWTSQKTLLEQGEAYIVYESGKSPLKVSQNILVPTGKTIAKIAFPEYSTVPYQSHFAQVFVDGKFKQQTIVMEDIGQMAKQALSDRRAQDLAKIAARVVTKDLVARKLSDENPWIGLAANAFNLVSEVADTRSWTSLPDTLQVARIELPAYHQTHIEIKPQAGASMQINVVLAPGEKKLIRMRTFN